MAANRCGMDKICRLAATEDNTLEIQWSDYEAFAAVGAAICAGPGKSSVRGKSKWGFVAFTEI